MTYNNKGLRITLRVVILSGFILAAVISFYETDFVVTPIMFLLLAVVTAAELIWYIGRVERNFTRFLLSIKHHDFSRSYKNQSEYKELQEAFDLITQSFEDLETQKHADYRLLQTVSEHIRIGLVCYNPEGEVMFANKAFREMLGLKSFGRMKSISQSHRQVYQHMIAEKPVSGVLVGRSDEEKLLLKTEAFTLRNQHYKLASLYDIKSTLDTNELESYQKLMKVMTHEIMNSATPVLSLIQVVNKKLIDDEKIRTLPDKDQANIAVSLHAIETQTGGILKFVESYRKINKEIKPDKQKTTVSALIEPIIALLIEPSEVAFTFDNQVEDEIWVDAGLIAQTILNLLKNALEAVGNQTEAQIYLTAAKEKELLMITIEDNGGGVLEEQLKEIFVPFFSTKPNGSGIGLALSRKIVNAHGGSLTCKVTDQQLTQFKILLPKEVFLPE